MKDLENKFRETFDHKTIIDKNEPHIEWFKTGQSLGLLDLVILDDGVGCEMFALKVYKITEKWLNDSEFEGRCKVTKVEVSEHGANSAIYLP